MLTNATITRIDRQGDPDATGRTRRTEGDAVEIRCALDVVSGRQRYTLGAVLEDATQVVYAERDALAVAGEDPPTNGDQLIIQADSPGSPPGPLPGAVTVITTGDRLAPEGMGLSHIELFVRREPS